VVQVVDDQVRLPRDRRREQVAIERDLEDAVGRDGSGARLEVGAEDEDLRRVRLRVVRGAFDVTREGERGAGQGRAEPRQLSAYITSCSRIT
jgi:hypothetical protein